MEQTRFERGMELLDRIDGRGGGAVLRSLEGVAPDLGNYIVEFAFGDVYARPGLSLEEREMVTLASLLTAGGCEPQLEVHLNAALNVGLSPEKIVEVLLQCVPYTGFPRVLNAVFAAKRVFEERGGAPERADR
ncbi:carboxymuconolactone decarboxylase family protein [uncultured Oscillibacter sp.]|uniref:carboxymuconolactone decarboxylase family protein n=1 Tax=uncultured Oscillibacter sp. TaxID=876091 RepID=UPI002626C184|nr:carboxymuconolactone decarboxylase family protein [uncultured Oscillibacter sp.]